jgi:undecaprenyl diphosphate synthase
MSATSVPRHVAIIMDGNGRWARARGFARTYGHWKGADIVKGIIRAADEMGIQVLTLYAFSTENWKRPSEEVDVLMKILRAYLERERKEMIENGIQFSVLGEIDRLPTGVREIVQETMELTKNATGLKLNFCVSYGSRAEMLRATKLLAADISSGKIKVEDVREDSFSKYLYTAGLPDPDLVIRTSGEYRLSNFLLWQIAYAEIWVTDTPWPEFTPDHLKAAIADFTRRDRRYGLATETSPAVGSKPTWSLRKENTQP